MKGRLFIFRLRILMFIQNSPNSPAHTGAIEHHNSDYQVETQALCQAEKQALCHPCPSKLVGLRRVLRTYDSDASPALQEATNDCGETGVLRLVRAEEVA